MTVQLSHVTEQQRLLLILPTGFESLAEAREVLLCGGGCDGASGGMYLGR